MSSPVARSRSDFLRALVVGVGLCWALAFAVIAANYELELYADGAMFSYAVAVQDVWAFHWHNIASRMSVLFLTLWPAEIWVGLTGKPWAGIVIYGLLFYLAPLAGLIGTFAADRSPGRVIFAYACCSTALLCPLVFGFPTEMWMAHAMFWPALAVSHYARQTIVGTALVLMMLLTLALTHEGALVLVAAIVATVALRGLIDRRFLRAIAGLALVLAASIATKITLPPDEYYAGVLLRAALHFFDLSIFQVAIVLLLFAALAGYGVIYLAASRFAPHRAYLYAAAAVIVTLGIYWLWLDRSIHASSRYYLRTALVIVTPLFGALAALEAISREDLSREGRLLVARRSLQRAAAWLRDLPARPLAAAFIIVTLIHVVETKKFVAAWMHYRTAVAALATGEQSDPSLGDPNFVSTDRLAASLRPLSWFSTTPYLSVIVANFMPNRLVVDPAGNYFWLSCATATANRDADRATPKNGRELIRIYSCLHR